MDVDAFFVADFMEDFIEDFDGFTCLCFGWCVATPGIWVFAGLTN